MTRESQARSCLRLWPLLLALAVLPAGCKKAEEDKNSIKGSVSVPFGDVGGVIVEAYVAPEFVSTDIWSTTAAHPEVGFPYDLPAAWDYRRQSSQPRARDTTGANGTFEFPDLADGDYILSARKAGYGWSVPRAVGLHGQSVDAGTLALAEVETLPASANLTGDNRWLSGRHYIIQSRLSVAAGATLTIEPGAVVRLPLDTKINVLGTLIAEGEPGRFIIFTSNEALPDLGDWWYILFSQSASLPQFRYCAFRYADDAIRSLRPGGRIESCFFGSIAAQGVSLLGNTDAAMDSIVFRRNVTNDVQLVLLVSNVAAQRPMLIERNAIYGCANYGVKLVTAYSGAVRCNWFYACGHTDISTGTATGALYMFNAQDVEVDHNEFRKSQYGVDLGSLVDSSVHIHNNYFYLLTRALNVGWTPETVGPSFPHFNFNCIQAVEHYHIYMGTCVINTESIDANNNYWDGFSEFGLRQRFLYDHDDDPTCPYVTVGTILPSCNRSEAGLCGM